MLQKITNRKDGHQSKKKKDVRNGDKEATENPADRANPTMQRRFRLQPGAGGKGRVWSVEPRRAEWGAKRVGSLTRAQSSKDFLPSVETGPSATIDAAFA